MKKWTAAWILGLGVAILFATSGRAAVVLTGGLSLTDEGPASATAGDPDVPDNLALGATAFALDQLDLGVHFVTGVTNGSYGNSSSWIGGGATGPEGPFVGIDLGDAFQVDQVAFGRSNVLAGDSCGGGVCTDRSLGLYVLQYTAVPSPDASLVTTGDAGSGWVDLGTLDYQSAGGTNFASPHLRHLYSFSPVVATGIRLLVPDTGLGAGTAIDEIEVYGDPIPLLTGGLQLIEEGPPAATAGSAVVPANLALGATAFALDQLDLGVHFITGVTNGSYGNSSSWIGGGATGTDGPFIGVDLGSLVTIGQVAFGRSNVLAGDAPCGGVCTDRTLGLYTLQFTTVPSPDETLVTTGNAGTGWVTIGTLDYQSVGGASFANPHQRHLYAVPPVDATGIRLIVPDTGLATGTAIDEIEVYGPVPIVSGGGLALIGEGPASASAGNPDVPANLALGATAFALDQLDLGVHFTSGVTNGSYGNSSSWIGGGATGTDGPFVGVDLGDAYWVDQMAFGRSNVLSGDPCAGGVCTDRTLGLYTLQRTTVVAPDETLVTTGDASTGWVDIGTIEYQGSGGDGFAGAHLRHLYSFTPVVATGIRLIVPDTGLAAGTAIDEIEVYGDPIPLLSSGLTLVEEGPAAAAAGNPDVPANLALGATAFALDELDLGLHFITGVTNGSYGNSSSWIGGGAAGTDGPFVGVDLAGSYQIDQMAFGRSNVLSGDSCSGGVCTDRSLGLYTLQYTAVASPDASLVTTGDASTGWVDIGAIEYQSIGGPTFGSPHQRHLYSFPPVVATGVRLIVPDTGLAAGTAIDEIEVYGFLVPVELMSFWIE